MQLTAQQRTESSLPDYKYEISINIVAGYINAVYKMCRSFSELLEHICVKRKILDRKTIRYL